jgi:hypothetical protein
MDTVTIACPLGFTDPSVDPATAPIWTDGTTDYYVASGPMDGYTVDDEVVPYVTSDPVQAQSDRVNVVVGMNGLDALAAMGLTVIAEQGSNNGRS